MKSVQAVQTCTPACELAASVAKKGCFADEELIYNQVQLPGTSNSRMPTDSSDSDAHKFVTLPWASLYPANLFV